MTLNQNWELMDVVRGGDYKPISKSGSFFDIPLPWAKKKPKNKHNDEGDFDGEEPDFDEE